jgi:SAM-dependent methyltransferase
MENWLDFWVEDDYRRQKDRDIQCMLEYVKLTPPETMLDIGCGLAWESRAVNQAHGTQLWLMDRDQSRSGTDVESSGWRADTSRFAAYNNLTELRKKLDQLGTQDYQLIDADNINLPSDLKFDLIYSSLSCGYHYSVECYRDLISRHSHSNTKVIMDIRKRARTYQPIEILEVIDDRPKHMKCLIRFVENKDV